MAVDYAKAFVGFKVAAEAGVASAQFCVGCAFDMGEGVPKDYGQARVWYEKSAAQGEATSVTALGHMAYRGDGQPPSYRRARELFQQAIDMSEFDVTRKGAMESMQELTDDIAKVRRTSLGSSATPPIPC